MPKNKGKKEPLVQPEQGEMGREFSPEQSSDIPEYLRRQPWEDMVDTSGEPSKGGEPDEEKSEKL